MGQRARERIDTHFNVHHSIEKTRTFFQEWVSTRQKA
jgi:hypothetical protein